jgi:hypothetical protein
MSACVKCGATDLVTIDAPGDGATVIVIAEDKNVTTGNTGGGAKIMVCKSCGHIGK